MALLSLHLEIDSDVHPELHAMLASIGKATPRLERLRQLASSGLIWEQLRVQSHLQVHGGVIADERGAGQPVALSSSPRTQSEDSAALPAPRAVMPPLREPPVLHDAVDVAELSHWRAIAARHDIANAASLRYATAAPSTPIPGSATVEPPSTPPRKSGTRSRLLRMKERGLFSNG